MEDNFQQQPGALIINNIKQTHRILLADIEEKVILEKNLISSNVFQLNLKQGLLNLGLNRHQDIAIRINLADDVEIHGRIEACVVYWRPPTRENYHIGVQY